MFLHVGNNQNIRIRRVIGIFDADSATVSSVTKKYLSAPLYLYKAKYY